VSKSSSKKTLFFAFSNNNLDRAAGLEKKQQGQ